MQPIKNRIFRIIEPDNSRYLPSVIYDCVQFLAIVLSLIPLTFKEHYYEFDVLEMLLVPIFIVDYLLRWWTAPIKQKQQGKSAYLRYPFTFMAIVDFVAILPALSLMSQSFLLFRAIRLLRIVRVLKLIRYSQHIDSLLIALKKERKVLLTVLGLALSYIFISALVMFNVEQQFDNFFDALYWATTTLTTVGYGDICPHSTIGRLISMISAIFGVAIIALPSGIITASYLEELRELAAEKEKEKKSKEDDDIFYDIN